MADMIPVAIVGAGPCGLFTALLLARNGIECAVYEKNSGLSSHPRAMGINRRTAEIYRQVGINAPLEAVSLPLEGKKLAIWTKTLTGEILGSVPLSAYCSEFTPATPQHCPQTETERILLDALRLEPLAEIHFNHEVTNVRLEPSGGELTFTNGETCVFTWLVAADGHASRIRRQLAIPTSGPGDMGHFLNIMFRAPLGNYLHDRQALFYFSVSNQGLNQFVSINNHDLWLLHHYLLPGSSSLPSNDQIIQIIRSSAKIPDLDVQILSTSPWILSPKIAATFRKERVFLVGDSAARLSPFGAMGLNNGLQSAHNLAWKLAAVIRNEADESLLDTYHLERYDASGTAMRISNYFTGEVFAIHSEAIRNNWDEVQRLISNSKLAGGCLGLELGLSYEKGAFIPDGSSLPSVVDKLHNYIPCARPGSRAPHVPIQSDTGENSTLDYFGQNFVLLACGGNWQQVSNLGCQVFTCSQDFTSSQFASTYGLSPTGAVLVRPDGIVAARWHSQPENPYETLRNTLNSILKKNTSS
ncbi:MAG: FAD-dependent monooxygenase [Chthoniobacterales bacterium]|nr:FAD-dependent monooxygenase [Chthoniobacterales bacterium]